MDVNERINEWPVRRQIAFYAAVLLVIGATGTVLFGFVYVTFQLIRDLAGWELIKAYAVTTAICAGFGLTALLLSRVIGRIE